MYHIIKTLQASYIGTQPTVSIYCEMAKREISNSFIYNVKPRAHAGTRIIAVVMVPTLTARFSVK